MTGPRGDKKCADWKRSSTSCCLSPILFNLNSECLTKEAPDGLGDFNIGGQTI